MNAIITSPPTLEIYNQMQQAYDYLNRELFEGLLPQCILSLHRHPRAVGYFIAKKYRAKGIAGLGDFTGEVDELDEIALNPDLMLLRNDKDSLSTLAHEQAHCWIESHGSGSRRGWHCKNWARRMRMIGLEPTPETGYKVRHVIVPKGPFDVAADKLLGSGFAFSWGSVLSEPVKGKKGKKWTYTCPSCNAKVFGKDGLSLQCLDCEELMEVKAPASMQPEDEEELNF